MSQRSVRRKEHRDPPLDDQKLGLHNKKGYANLKLMLHTDDNSFFPSDEPERGVLSLSARTRLLSSTAKRALSGSTGGWLDYIRGRG